MEFLAPSANRLPDEPDDLQPGQFRLDGKTFKDGQVKYETRRYFVQDNEVFLLAYQYDEADRRIAVFGSQPNGTTGWNTRIACDIAIYTNGESVTPLRICLDEGHLKFAVAG